MANLSIELTRQMVDYVEDQVASGAYVDADDFFSDLIRRRMEAVDRLRVLIDEGDASGVSPYTVEEIFARAKERHRSRAA